MYVFRSINQAKSAAMDGGNPSHLRQRRLTRDGIESKTVASELISVLLQSLNENKPMVYVSSPIGRGHCQLDGRRVRSDGQG
jgi:hypothetical protein